MTRGLTWLGLALSLAFCSFGFGVAVAHADTADTVTASENPALEPLSNFPQSLLFIRTSAGRVHSFKIWVADRPARAEQGLMFVKTMDDHAGMLFVFPRDQTIAMWMKNTFIPLDMLFISSDGHVSHIADNAVPQSLDTITAPQPVRFVLELNGGIAARFDIKVGDVVSSAALKALKAPHSMDPP